MRHPITLKWPRDWRDRVLEDDTRHISSARMRGETSTKLPFMYSITWIRLNRLYFLVGSVRAALIASGIICLAGSVVSSARSCPAATQSSVLLSNQEQKGLGCVGKTIHVHVVACFKRVPRKSLGLFCTIPQGNPSARVLSCINRQ